MIYHLINIDRSYGGNVGTEPTHNNWTNVPYNGGLIKETWNGSDWAEGATHEEITQFEQEKFKELDIEYTQRISELVEKHVQKNIIDGTPIPKEVLEERERLKEEFKSLTNKDLKK